MGETAELLDLGDAGSYVNYLGTADVRDAYPAPTYERLAAVKRRYDPDNVFASNHNVAPA